MVDIAVTPPENTGQTNRPYSRPVFLQVIGLNSLQSQRIMERSFSRVSNSLFSLDVILRIIGEQDEVDEVESMIVNEIAKVAQDLDEAMSVMGKLMEDNGIDAVPAYSAPMKYEIEITSPQVAQFARLLQALDELMGRVDTLWLNSVFNSKQRSDANYQWQQRLFRLSGRIINWEKRARISANSKGKEQEVSEAAPEQINDDPELTDAAAEADVALAEETPEKKVKKTTSKSKKSVA